MAENNSRIQKLVPNVKKDRSSHRRSIAELWRRTEISKRVQNLQELIPNMEKVIKQTVGTPKPYTNMALPGINPLVVRDCWTVLLSHLFHVRN
uniref:BHLH domain-containing protein n=1 Tax=Hordeum vulgare subsp. vulgare TaxID=112509 RepID=A0A8I6Y813_HORVV